MLFYIEGTTYSGNPVRTTLGNTIRSILYMYFYAYKAGLFSIESWKNYRGKGVYEMLCWCIASGDDTVMWVLKKHVGILCESVRKLSSSDKKFAGIRGLGQIIVDQSESYWWDTEFCSKWFYMRQGSQQLKDWVCTRDMKKLFTTKMFFKGENPLMLIDETIHAEAILGGIVAETSSVVIKKLC